MTASSGTRRAHRRPSEPTLWAALGFVFNQLHWRLRLANESPFELVVEGDAAFEGYRDQTSFPLLRDRARAAVVRAVVGIAGRVKPAFFRLAFRAPLSLADDPVELQRKLARYRGVLKAHVRSAIARGGYDAVVDVATRTPVEPQASELQSSWDCGRIRQTDLPVSEAHIAPSEELLRELAFIDPLLCDWPAEPPSLGALRRATKYAFDVMSWGVRVCGRELRVEPCSRFASYRDGLHRKSERDAALTIVTRTVEALVLGTDPRTLEEPTPARRPRKAAERKQRPDMTLYRGALRAQLLQAVEGDAVQGLSRLILTGLQRLPHVTPA